MASIQKTTKGYRAQIKVLGVRDSRLFSTKREASQWAAQREAAIRQGTSTACTGAHTLREALRRYADEVSPTKRGARWEKTRLAAFERYALPLDSPIAQVTAQDMADFRDARLAVVKNSSVLRELVILSALFETARLEWGWVTDNPVQAIRKPTAPLHRERVMSPFEVRGMLRSLDYKTQGKLRLKKQAVAAALLFALRTGMRAGEICGLTWDNVHALHVRLPMTKNGKAREVPLSSRARRLIERMRGFDKRLVFGLDNDSRDALFRKHRDLAGLCGFTFHDTRHTAATMMAKKVDVLTLCKIFGWSNTSQALTYYNPKAASIAALLG